MSALTVPPEISKEIELFKDYETIPIDSETLIYSIWLRKRIETDMALLAAIYERQIVCAHLDKEHIEKSTVWRLK